LTLKGARSSSSWKTGDVADLLLEEVHRRAHGAAALVHEGGGLEQEQALAADPALLRPAVERLLRRLESVRAAIASAAMKPTLCRCMA
jgi:hypothetical protein